MNMSKIDLTGQKFGLLTVLEKDLDYVKLHNIQGRRVYWKCQCECGNFTSVRTNNLTQGLTKSCGCLNSTSKQKDLTGQRFGKLVVLHESDERKNGRRAWVCQCDCGNITTVNSSNLRENGGTISCGCAAIDNKLIDMTGQRFGKLTVLSYIGQGNNRSSLWKCKCDCGNEVIRTRDALRMNTFSSCGCTTESIGVNCIKELLTTNNPFVQEKTFETCRFPDTQALARFDFYVNNQFIIEYDGQQHFHSTEYGYYNEDSFNKLKEHDEFKNHWCINNNIILKRIPFWRINSLTINELMDDDTFIVRSGE